MEKSHSENTPTIDLFRPNRVNVKRSALDLGEFSFFVFFFNNVNENQQEKDLCKKKASRNEPKGRWKKNYFLFLIIMYKSCE